MSINKVKDIIGNRTHDLVGSAGPQPTATPRAPPPPIQNVFSEFQLQRNKNWANQNFVELSNRLSDRSTVCGVWCVVCGVWCVVCGVWCVVCGVWCVVCGATTQLETRSPHG
jgi:hypothetical protein